MMTVIVTACKAFGLTVSEAKTEICTCKRKLGGKGAIHRHCCWPGVQRNEFVPLVGAISAD